MPVKRLILMLATALICAVLASVLVVRYVRTREEEARRTRMEAQPIVVAANNIPMGTRLDAGLITVRDWPKAGVPQGALSERDAAVGRLVKGEITRDEPILESRLFPKDVSGTPGIMSVMVPPGKRAMAVGVNEVIGVSGFILPKDRVDVIATRSDQSSKSSETILQNIEVLAAGKRLEQEGKQNVEVPTLTLAVSPPEAERLALALQQGKIHIALRSVMDRDRQEGHLAASAQEAVVRRKAGSRKTQADTKPEKKEGKMIEIEVIRGDKRTTETYPIETP
ncbi:SAF domain protein [Candidatus Methylomirabilis lanthanidiphila]|uniref:SAF domain protein n=1 Tax=Candidatus Methylomirabilis lanthanidiphila TaxID=2211376 RepID=A0A564ZGT6_9BACT|nr:Flp pilus assembly protein CpaB [Candidatus Methylomirabilis lanthanidiphila]VUZ84373.1 SAF domain protein [Candidatus Methylomirabilis lanthanidiphila]